MISVAGKREFNVIRALAILHAAALLLSSVLVCGVSIVALADEEEGVSGEAVVPSELHELTQTIAAALDDITLDGWNESDVERYVVANLYDKINGRSELFMSYGVKAMAFKSFANSQETTQYIDVFLYDMGSVHGAFGAYSVERWGEWKPIELGRDGYRTDTDVFFWKGRYYVSVLGSHENTIVREAQQKLAGQLAEQLKDTEDKLWGLEVLPEEGLTAGSVQYFMVDALSLSFLDNTYTAEYRRDEQDVKVFISRQDSHAEAKSVYDQFVSFMKRYGNQLETLDAGGTPLSVADMGGGYYDAVFLHGAFVAGVTSVQYHAQAIDAAQRFRRDLEDATPQKR